MWAWPMYSMLWPKNPGHIWLIAMNDMDGQEETERKPRMPFERPNEPLFLAYLSPAMAHLRPGLSRHVAKTSTRC